MSNAPGGHPPSPPPATRDQRAREERFRTFADTAPAMLWVTERDGTCTYLSREWYDFTGQTEAEGLQYGWLDAVHPSDREAARQLFLEANAARAPFALQHRLRRADGAYRWVSDAGRPRLDDDGTFRGYVGAVIDIHDRTIAEERLAFAVTSGGVGLWYCDLPFDVLVWDAQVKDHFGLSPEAAVTIETFYDRIHPDDRHRTRAAIERALAERSTYDTHFRTFGRDGCVRWIRAVGRASYDGDRPIRFDGITVDVTELVTLRERSDAANRAKDEFLATLAHELRNPLAPICNALEILRLPKASPETLERARAMMERQVHHLVRLVDDLLDVSRVMGGKIKLRRERVELAAAIARAVETVQPLMEALHHELRVAVPSESLPVEADTVRLAQVIANLLTNAAKYTNAGGQVTLDVERVGDGAVIRVRDNGIGIETPMLARVFDLFVQADHATTRSQGGLGIGLTLAKNLVEMHGGTIEAQSDGLGQGTQMVVTLPLLPSAEPEDVAAPPLQQARSPGPGARVLVVDDNRDAAESLAWLLGADGHEMHVAFDGPTALELVEQHVPDIAFVDIGMPGMDGFEVARRIRNGSAGRDVLLIALTGWGQPEDRRRSADAGFDHHLVKPPEHQAVQRLLKRWRSSGPTSTSS